MAVGDAHVFPGFLIPVLTQLNFSKPPTRFLTCFRGDRHKYAGKIVCLNRVSNSQPPGHESDMLTTEPPGQEKKKLKIAKSFDSYPHKLILFTNAFNPSPNKPWFLRVSNTSLLKTLREKEKLLVTSNFSFFHSVFNPFGEFSAIFIKFDIVVCKFF